MSLVIWTSAKPETVKSVIGATLQGLRPKIPPHRFIPVTDELPQVLDGELVLACGEQAKAVLQAHKLLPKNRQLGGLREQVISKPGITGTYLLTYDPATVYNQPANAALIDWDVRLASRYLHTGSLKPAIGDYQWVNSFGPLIEEIERQHAKTGKPVDLAMDTETMGFFPWYPDKDVVSIAFTVRPGMAAVMYLGPQQHPVEISGDEDLLAQIDWLLNSPKVKLRGANLKYDLVWIATKWGIECTNFKFDTMLVGALLNENRSNGLNNHAKMYTHLGGYDDDFNDRYDKGKMEEIPAGDDLLTYAGGDTDACYQVADQLRDELLNDEPLAKFYVTILHPAARAFEKIERRGVLIDQEKMAVLRQDLRKEIDAAYVEALDILPNRLRLKHRDKINDQLAEGKAPITNAILAEYYFTPAGINLKPKKMTPSGKGPSTAKDHLDMFYDEPAAKQMHAVMTRAARAAKTLSTFVDGFLDDLRPDGLIHPTYFLAPAEFAEAGDETSGTVTGRLSAKNPPFQIIPKKTDWAKRVRECYPAPKGKVVLSIDYSQGELRIVACVAEERTMIDAYQKGLDLHAVTGAKLSGNNLEEFLKWKDADDGTEEAKLFEKYRGNAKPANFGLLYGMQAPGFRDYAWKAYGKMFTMEEAEAICAAFFSLYPGLPSYHATQRAFVKRFAHVRSPLGRIRHLETIRAQDRYFRSRAELQAINSPIQSCLSDMMIWAIALIEAAGIKIEIVGMIHDALIAYVDEDKVQSVFEDCYGIMANLPFKDLGWNPILKFPVDGECGHNLAGLKKMKLGGQSPVQPLAMAA